MGKNKRIFLTVIIVIVALCIGLLFIKYTENKNTQTNGDKTSGNVEANFKQEKLSSQELTTELKMLILEINKALENGQWDISMLNNLNERLIQLQARLSMNEIDNKVTITDVFKQCDIAVYSMNFTGKENQAEYDEVLAKVKQEMDKTRELLGVENTYEYQKDKILSSMKDTLISWSKDSSPTKYVSLMNAMKDIYALDNGNLDNQTLDMYRLIKLRLFDISDRGKEPKGAIKELDALLVQQTLSLTGYRYHDVLQWSLADRARPTGTMMPTADSLYSSSNFERFNNIEKKEYTAPNTLDSKSAESWIYNSIIKNPNTANEYTEGLKIRIASSNVQGSDKLIMTQIDRYHSNPNLTEEEQNAVNVFDNTFKPLEGKVEIETLNKLISDYALYYSRYNDGVVEKNNENLKTLFEIMEYNTRISDNGVEIELFTEEGTNQWYNISTYGTITAVQVNQ